MTEYTTDTGYYVLVTQQGTVYGYASVTEGSHPVGDEIDVTKTFDVESPEKFSNYPIDSYV